MTGRSDELRSPAARCAAEAALHLVLVPHTHWDREWYLTHEMFRHRLVHLLDELLDLLERDPGFRHFTLDGQTIVLADYRRFGDLLQPTRITERGLMEQVLTLTSIEYDKVPPEVFQLPATLRVPAK